MRSIDSVELIEFVTKRIRYGMQKVRETAASQGRSHESLSLVHSFFDNYIILQPVFEESNMIQLVPPPSPPPPVPVLAFVRRSYGEVQVVFGVVKTAPTGSLQIYRS